MFDPHKYDDKCGQTYNIPNTSPHHNTTPPPTLGLGVSLGPGIVMSVTMERDRVISVIYENLLSEIKSWKYWSIIF